MIKRRPFILVEVLIAISLLALVIIPLSSFPFKALKKEKEMIALVECERIFGLAHAALLAHLQDHPIKEAPIDLGDYQSGKLSYHATAELILEKEKDQHHLYKVVLSLLPPQKQAPSAHQRTFSIMVNNSK